MPTYNLSTSWGLPHYQDLGQFARDARTWGFAAIEANYGVKLTGLEELKASGVPVSSLHFPGPLIPQRDGSPPYTGPLVPADPDERQIAREHAVRVLEAAGESGARAVVFHAADLPQLRDLESALARLCAGGANDGASEAARQELTSDRASAAVPLVEAVMATIGRLLPIAERYGLRLGLETRADVRDIPSREEMRQVLSSYPSGHLGYWHDTGHAHRQELLGFGPARGWLEEFGDRLVGMHLSDCRGLEDHYPPGQGEIDFAAILAFTRTDTVRTLEIAGRHSEAEVRAGLEYLQQPGGSG